MTEGTMGDAAANRTRALDHARRLKDGGIKHLIGERWTSSTSGKTFETSSPIDGTAICTVPAGDAEDVDGAALAAQAAFRTWREVPGKERKRLLHAVANAIEAHAQEIALLETLDTGQPIRFMNKAAQRGAENFRFFADRCESAGDGLSLPTRDHLYYTIRQPIGPVGVITPWNTPFMLSTWKIAPALAAGCTVVHKPAEWSPVTAVRLHEIMLEAGIPQGVVNLVHGYGETAGKSLTEHPAIKAVAFVGESATGKAIQRQGADTLKRGHFELGGKNPVVVFSDADLERALDAVVFMIYSLNGERCTSSSRLLVERGIYDEFVSRVAQRAERIQVGDPFDPGTEVGPLIHASHFDKVCSYFELARNEGATVAAGGQPHPLGGQYVPATLFANARNDMRIAQEEIFGPVLTAIPFDGEEEAVKLANDVPYGLAAYIWTRDASRVHRLARDVEAGMVWANSENVRYLPTPFGGIKASGVGRDGGDYSFDFYMETKSVAVAMGEHRIPKLG